MSVKTEVSQGQQFIDIEGNIYGLTSKDEGKHWRICKRKNVLWVALKGSEIGLKQIVGDFSFTSEESAQNMLNLLARRDKWKKLKLGRD